MKSRVILFSFLFVSCMICGLDGAFAAATKTVATTNYVENRITKTNGAVEIQNDSGKTVTVKNNPTASALSTTSNVVTTVGWTDSNRTSKVKSVEGNTTSLVDMWIE